MRRTGARRPARAVQGRWRLAALHHLPGPTAGVGHAAQQPCGGIALHGRAIWRCCGRPVSSCGWRARDLRTLGIADAAQREAGASMPDDPGVWHADRGDRHGADLRGRALGGRRDVDPDGDRAEPPGDRGRHGPRAQVTRVARIGASRGRAAPGRRSSCQRGVSDGAGRRASSSAWRARCSWASASVGRWRMPLLRSGWLRRRGVGAGAGFLSV